MGGVGARTPGPEATPSAAVLLEQWRLEITRWIVLALAAAAGILTVFFWRDLGAFSRVMGLALAGLFVALATSPRVPLGLRTGVILVGCTYAGIMAQLSGHDAGASVGYFFLGIVLSTLLTPRWVTVLLLVAAVLTFGVAAVAEQQGVNLIPATAVLTETDRLWGTAFSTAVVGGITVASVSFVVSKLESTLDTRADDLRKLAQESAEREAALAELRASQAQLVRAGKMELLGQLAGSVAHDMNNALTVVLGEAELVREAAPSEAQAIAEAVEHASSLTRQLLAIGWRDVVRRRPLSLWVQVQQGANMMRRTLPADVSLRLERDEAAGEAVILADAHEIQQMLLNLGSNAGHAMPEGGEISVVVSGSARGVQLTVRDEGQGMDAETASHIFEPFFTTKGEGVGTGLGLASVKAIVDELEGRIECESTLGEGTEFRITLPRHEGSAEGTAANAEAPPDASRLRGLTVLVADDEPAVRRTVARALRRAGVQVAEASDGEDAITQAEAIEGRIDLLWTDVIMARGGGGAVVAWFACARPETTVVVCTGHSDDEVLRRDMSLGRFHLVRKPFAPSDVVRACLVALESDGRDRESQPRARGGV